jgi:N-methylhydantoinase B
LPSIVRGLALKRGDVLRVDTPGGAGYGRPDQRDPDRSRVDLAQGKVTGDEGEGLHDVDE